MRRGKPWCDSDVECARFLRHCGLSDRDIGAILNRSAASIAGKIGYGPSGKRYARFYERARPMLAQTFGAMADQIEPRGCA